MTDSRRVRIESDVGATSPSRLRLTDLSTGSPIEGVYRVSIWLDARQCNRAVFSYYQHDEQGGLVVRDGVPQSGTFEAVDPQVDLTAFEVLAFDEDEQEERRRLRRVVPDARQEGWP